MRPTSAIAAALLLAAGALPALAEESSRVEKLEREVADLRRLVEDLQRDRADGTAPPPEPPPSAHGHVQHGPARLGRPELMLGGFGHVQYNLDATDPDSAPSDTDDHFSLGPLDLFLTARLGDRITFLSELVVEFEEGGESPLDAERLLASYDHADWLRATIGRTHTPLGYWNTTYHHGTWLQTTVDRPLLFLFEDDGGILPVHTVGLELSGYLNTGIGSVGYTLNTGNGRGRLSEQVQIAEDLNDSKMFAGMLTFAPDAIEGLSFGANLLIDTIRSDPATPTLATLPQLQELIAGGFLAYLADPLELLVEGQWIRHRDRGQDDSFHSAGGYAQLAYKWGDLKPYYRFDWLSISSLDPYFLRTPGAEDTFLHTWGVRWDWQEFAAFKVEVRRRLSDSFDAVEGAAQISFAF